MIPQHRDGVTRTHVFASWLAGATGLGLDVGCGAGGAMAVVGPGLRMIGADVSLEACRKSRVNGERAVCADLAGPLPFRDGAFDVAICSDTFEHLVDPLGLLAEIRRVLRPGGRLLAHVPNEFSWKSLRQVLRGDGIVNRDFFPGAEEWDYPHLRFFTHRGFRRMLERGGFVVEADATSFGRGWRRRLYPLFGSGPSFVARRDR